MNVQEVRLRKPSREVRLDDIIAGQLLGTDSDVLAIVLKTHLALEAIILEIIKLFLTDDRIYKLSFPQKTEALFRQGFIVANDKAAFDIFNNFRNDFAHIFGHRVTLADALAVARELETLGIDFSDSIGRYSEKEAISFYGGLFGVLEEIGWCILSHAAFLLSERGGRSILA